MDTLGRKAPGGELLPSDPLSHEGRGMSQVVR
jgi:hypothetical protein